MFGSNSTTIVGLGASGSGGLIFGIVFGLVLIVGGIMAVRWVRRWYRDTEVDSSGSGGFSLQELRELRSEGRISEEEYDAAKAIVLGLGSGAIKDGSVTGNKSGRNS